MKSLISIPAGSVGQITLYSCIKAHSTISAKAAYALFLFMDYNIQKKKNTALSLLYSECKG